MLCYIMVITIKKVIRNQFTEALVNKLIFSNIPLEYSITTNNFINKKHHHSSNIASIFIKFRTFL